MKKSTKLISLLLVLVMLLGIIPMAVAADDVADDVASYAATPEVKLITKNLDGRWVEFGSVTNPATGKSESADYITAIGEQDNYQLLPVGTVGGKTYAPVAYYVPKTGSVTVSNDGIIDDLSFSMEYYYTNRYGFYGTPSLQFNFKAVAPGSTTVKVTYYYNFNISNTVGGKTWYKSVSTFNITVSDEQVQKPDKPTESDLKRFHNFVNKTSTSEGAVYMWCGESLHDHGAWFDYITEVPGAYTLGEVTANDGSVMSAINYPWTCTMTIDANKYLEAYNSVYAEELGQHYLVENEPKFQTVTWYYRAGEYKWNYIASKAPIYIDITHTAPTPAVTEYTVTYTDGVDGAAFADQTYTVKENDPTPAFEGEPSREGYVFLGWGPEVAETVTGNATYTATWEEALTEVKVTSSISEGALLYLGSEFKVTATANTDAKLTFNFEANPAFKQIASDATGNSKTVWYRVVKITGNYTKINVSVTGTKGNQEPVTGTLSFGVNLRNRIHVTIKTTSGEIIATAENVKLNHKYPQWNTCPALKYDAAKQEYVMKNPWDLSSQEFVSVSFEYDGETYETKVTRDGENIFDVIRAGEKEIYVEYTIVDPIYLTIEVDGVSVVENEKYKGQKDEKMDYFQKLKEVQQNLLDENKTTLSMATYVDGQLITGKYTPLFGANKTVKIVITTNA